MNKMTNSKAEHAEAASAAPIQLETFLPYRLNLLATEVSQTLARAYGEKFGISIPEWRVIATLGQFGSITAREIGLHSRMHKTTVSRAVSALERRKLILRRPNKEDMREAFLAMTESGRAVYFDIVPMARNFADSLCEGLNAEERRVLEGLINRLQERVLHLSGHPSLADQDV
jgi:DNA-binding MarR family transcriptional regulator